MSLFLLGIVGIGSIGLNLISRYWQTQQLKQVKQAREQLEQGQYISAIATYDKILKTDFAQPEILWANRGYAYLGLGQYQSALQSCSKATDIEPEVALAWNCQGEAQFHLGHQNAAFKAFQMAIATEPNNATFKLNQSQILQEQGQHDQALKLNQKAISLLESQQSNSESILALAFKRQGQSWLELDNNNQALTAFNQSLVNDPEDLFAQQGKAIALYRLGKYSQAIKTINQILLRQDLTPEQEATSWLYKAI
ncbi:MAG: tetratricopeptide repeat protein, partial [Cyanobacteria bacterium J06600_6]